jgi:hypothetical protein
MTFIFHFIYGMSSFPLTNFSFFSRWLRPGEFPTAVQHQGPIHAPQGGGFSGGTGVRFTNEMRTNQHQDVGPHRDSSRLITIDFHGDFHGDIFMVTFSHGNHGDFTNEKKPSNSRGRVDTTRFMQCPVS